MSRRVEKANSLIRDIAAQFSAVNLNVKNVIISVAKAEVNRDLKHAKIFISVFPKDKNIFVLDELRRAKSEFQRYLASRFKAKFTPVCEFFIDKGEENARRIEELLKN
ncbi:MAG: hypothetical protein A2909_01640 [Candidatus Tagabacteria bacterium RIFCSPLOWO2_01_FULL_39_11]|uniref:Ribosome-binding factor A n=1 Tax=Candidatus Tagabacteria bacterium RIFCSPLOWO2_01_FULL_39_11 TaxID=1802295 RepID=A0A1G2LSY9_9BACT|nr:MAG: hypothetical protein A2909_01640 [Candidatus Tagabacteria bacterium RIFCSPLOWO2_01_FULL_39_11]